MLSGKTIFISPLDWGLGHSTRCVPIIKDLLKNNNVIIGVSELNKFFFEEHFPTLQKIDLPSYNIQYSKNLPVWLKVLFQFSKIKRVIDKENKLLKEIIKENKIDLVISDNRFGLYNKNVESIFITHQLNIMSPVFLGLATKKNQEYIHHFNKVWVPDHKNENERIAGQLSNSKDIKIPVEYIGPQSALKDLEIKPSSKKIEYLVLLSGVEPQRSNLEKKLVEKFKDHDKKIVLVRGSKSELVLSNKNIEVFNFAFGAELKQLLITAETIICRSGYSTLMDLHVLGKKKMILIPTPGQTEQEYLAYYWKEKFGAKVIMQKAISLAEL